MTELEKLLYRKKVVERTMSTAGAGAKIYDEYLTAIDKKISSKSTPKYEKLALKLERFTVENKGRNFVTLYRENRREYDDILVPAFEKLSEKEKEGVEFEETKKKMEEMAELELYGRATPRPENIEHVEIIESIKEHIGILEGLLKTKGDELGFSSDEHDKALLRKELFDIKLNLIGNNKRLSEREKYYYDVFKPRFDKEMVEANKYLDVYLQRAKELSTLGIDPKIIFMLGEYEKNKNDKDKLWLFYTSLRTRVDDTMKHMRKHKGQFKGKMSLAKKIL